VLIDGNLVDEPYMAKLLPPTAGDAAVHPR